MDIQKGISDLRKRMVAVAAVMLATAAYGQNKLDLHSRFTLMSEQSNVPHLVRNGEGRSVRRMLPMWKTHVTGLIRLAEGATADDLRAEGVEVMRQRGDIAIVNVLTSDAERVAGLKCVRRMQLARPVQQKMINVRPEIGVDKIHAGEGLPQAYTGKGVVTGTVDAGLDPNHVNFLDSKSNTRFGYLSRIYVSSGSSTGYVYENYYPRAEASYYQDALAIEDFKSDSKETYHGTHTLGIMSGSYKGNITAATIDPATGLASVQTGTKCPFYGIATESEIVASCGDLYDSFIAFGLEDIINYAAFSGKKRKPAVINLSLGSNAASHDTASLMNRYLDACGREAIVCVAAGNEGNVPLALRKTFSEGDTELKSFFAPVQDTIVSEGVTFKNLRYGQIVAYSNDSTEFSLQIVVWNKKRGSTALRIPVTGNTEGQYIVYCSGDDYKVSDAAITSQTFAKAFNGYVAVGSMIDEDTGRYYADINLYVSDNEETNADGNYLLGLIIEGKDGQRVNCYGEGFYNYFSDYGIEGWQDGSCDGTISDMACAHNIISVGSYNLQSTWAALDGEVYGYSTVTYPYGEVTEFSSWGTLDDGRTMPDVCAPGMAIVSSVNTYCVENTSMGYSDAALEGMNKKLRRNDYWQASAGTSMAVPVVAGSIALWLEADPNLTVDDVREIIHQTAVRDAGVEKGNPVQWGAGKFNAYEGLKLVLERKATGISPTPADDNRMLVQPAGNGTYKVFVAGTDKMDVQLVSTSGQIASRQRCQGNELTLQTEGLPRGIYVLRANNKYTQKIVVK